MVSTVTAVYHKIFLPYYGFILLHRHFPTMNLILSFPGVCYQFSSLFTVRSCVLQLLDTRCSIRITLCMVTKKALAYGKHNFHTLQASESALITKPLSDTSSKPHQGVSAQQMCAMQSIVFRGNT